VIRSFIALAVVLLTLTGCVSAGSKTGWTLKWSTDFRTSVRLGQFSGCDTNVNSPDASCSGLPRSVRSEWWAYPYPWPDTATKDNYPVGGYYDPAHTIWISGGQMHIRMFRTTSWIHSAAVVAKAADGVKYGEFIETFSVSHADPGYKAAHLLWPMGDNRDYEVDFPEDSLDSRICAFVHSIYLADQVAYCPGVSWTGWHTSEIQWAPGSLTFYLDGRMIGQTKGSSVPDEDMAWIIQNESALIGPSAAPGSWAQINISYVAVYSYTG
jgi:hypothetical protein